jgi:hypothetical protein
VIVDSATTGRAFQNELRWNRAAYFLERGP